MSNKIENENELWDRLSQPASETTKTEAPKASPKKPAPQKAPARKLDGFFYGCMAGVAAVSVALTLVVSSMVGGGSADPTYPVKQPGGDDPAVPGESMSQAWLEDYEALARENEALQATVDLQKEQIKNLQNDLMELMGTDEYLSHIATDPTGGNEVLDSQKQALELLKEVQAAYAVFDRAKLEELIPKMDEMLGYLPTEALNDYYLILEYVEQPSNG